MADAILKLPLVETARRRRTTPHDSADATLNRRDDDDDDDDGKGKGGYNPTRSANARHRRYATAPPWRCIANVIVSNVLFLNGRSAAKNKSTCVHAPPHILLLVLLFFSFSSARRAFLLKFYYFLSLL